MRAEVKKVGDLFSDPVQYVIPEFQRSYSWEKEKQWEPLWDDVRGVAERALKNRSNGHSRVAPHFMGALVLQTEPDAPADVPSVLGERSIVVDGQQRLTTLQILVRAVVGVADGLEISDGVDGLRSLVANADLEGPWRFKVLHSDEWDQNACRRLMRDPSGDRSVKYGDTTPGRNRIDACYDCLSGLVSEYLDVDDLGLRSQRLSGLEEAILMHLEVAVLRLEPDEQPNMVFETLNARGQELAQYQLVKNTVMLEAGVVTDKARAKACWHAFEDPWWSDKDGQYDQVDRFLAAWLTSVRRKPVQNFRISTEFRAFVNDWKSDGKDVWDAFGLLNRGGQIYWDVVSGVDPECGDFYSRLSGIEAASVLPVCLWMREAVNGLSEGDAKRVVDLLESYIFRRALVKFLPVPLSVFMGLIDVAEDAVRADIAVRDKVRDRLVDGTPARAEYWPEDVYLIDFLTRQPCGAKGPALKAALICIENYLRAEAGVPPIEDGKSLSVHYLMPKARHEWDSDGNWPILGRDRPSKASSRGLAVDKIGNVTLLAGKLPPKSRADAVSWERKQGFMLVDGPLYMNRLLLDMDVWDEARIDARSRELAEHAVAVWRR